MQRVIRHPPDRRGKKCKTHSHILCCVPPKCMQPQYVHPSKKHVRAHTLIYTYTRVYFCWAGIKASVWRDSFNYQVLSLCLWFQFLSAKLVMIFKKPAGNSDSFFSPCLSFPLKCEYPSLWAYLSSSHFLKSLFCRTCLFFLSFFNVSLTGRNGNKGFLGGGREERSREWGRVGWEGDQCRMYYPALLRPTSIIKELIL